MKVLKPAASDRDINTTIEALSTRWKYALLRKVSDVLMKVHPCQRQDVSMPYRQILHTSKTDVWQNLGATCANVPQQKLLPLHAIVR